jgi:hypothetical protein
MTVKLRELLFLGIFLAAFTASLYVKHYFKVETLTQTAQVFYYLGRDFYQLLLPGLTWISMSSVPKGTPFTDTTTQRVMLTLMGLLAIASLAADIYGVFYH